VAWIIGHIKKTKKEKLVSSLGTAQHSTAQHKPKLLSSSTSANSPTRTNTKPRSTHREMEE
jgi:hypothetical protein